MSDLRLPILTHRCCLRGGAALALLLLAPSLEAAPARRYALAWSRGTGAESCPEAAELQTELERLHGHTSFASRANADLVIEGVVRKGNGYTATITLRGADGRVFGERRLESNDPSCHELTREVVLVTTLMIERRAAEEQSSAAPAMSSPTVESGAAGAGPAGAGAAGAAASARGRSGAVGGPADPLRGQPVAPSEPSGSSGPQPGAPMSSPLPSTLGAPEPAAPQNVPRAGAATSQPRVEFAPVISVATGVLPSARVGVGGDFWAFLHIYARIHLGVRYWGGESVMLLGKDAGARFESLGVLAFFCPLRLARDRFRFFACAGVDARWFSVAGVGGDPRLRGSARELVVAPGAELRVTYTLGTHWVLSALVAAEVPTRRDFYQFQGPTEAIGLFQPDPVSVRLEAGVGYTF